MSVELLCVCDECHGRIEDGEEVFCIDCWTELKGALGDCGESEGSLEDENAKLRKDIEGHRCALACLQDELQEAETKIRELS